MTEVTPALTRLTKSMTLDADAGQRGIRKAGVDTGGQTATEVNEDPVDMEEVLATQDEQVGSKNGKTAQDSLMMTRKSKECTPDHSQE